MNVTDYKSHAFKIISEVRSLYRQTRYAQIKHIVRALKRTDCCLIFMDKNYNYTRKKLLLPEYGRHIHEMIDFLQTIEDRELRNRQARIIIGVMGNLNPTLRDTADFTHKLWDHLFIMADFELDVDSPYPTCLLYTSRCGLM